MFISHNRTLFHLWGKQNLLKHQRVSEYYAGYYPEFKRKIFTEVFNIDDVTANDVIQRNQHRKEKKINLSSIVITDIKLAS